MLTFTSLIVPPLIVANVTVPKSVIVAPVKIIEEAPFALNV